MHSISFPQILSVAIHPSIHPFTISALLFNFLSIVIPDWNMEYIVLLLFFLQSDMVEVGETPIDCLSVHHIGQLLKRQTDTQIARWQADHLVNLCTFVSFRFNGLDMLAGQASLNHWWFHYAAAVLDFLAKSRK